MRTRLVILILLAAAIRLLGLQTQSLWFDEGWSAFAAVQPNLIAAFNADLTNPPLYYVLLNVHAHLLGDSEFSLRLFSLLNSLLTIPLSYQLGKRIAGESEGWYAALLVTLSAQLWWAAQEARMYTLLAVLILIAALAWQRLLTRPTRTAWLALIVAELLLLYAHNTGVVAALWLNVVTLIAWLVRRRADRPHWRGWISSQVLVGLIWLPYFVLRFLNLSEANAAVTSAPHIGFALIFELWLAFLIAPYSILRSEIIGFMFLVYISLIPVMIAALLVIRRHAAWLGLHVLVLTLGLVAALIVLGNDLHGRYLVMIVPLLFTVCGVVIAQLPKRWRVIPVIAFGIPFALSWQLGQDPLYGHDDARGMVQYYADHLTADDTVLAWSYADRYELAYYWDRLSVQARRVTLPEGADLDQVLPLLPTSGDVALNMWYTQRADYRGMLDCVLQHGTLTPPEQFTTYGMTNNLYRSSVPLAPDFAPLNAVFTDNAGTPLVRVDAVGAIPALDAGAALCLPVQITLLAPTAAELKAKLIVQNDFGMEIARADAPFATANQRTSESLAPGDSLSAYPVIRLPYGAPAGTYRLYLRVYNEASNLSGLTPPADQPASGRDLLLGVWDAPTATWTYNDAWSDIVVEGDLHNNAMVTNGDLIRFSVQWNIPPQTLTLRGENWSIQLAPPAARYPTLAWHLVRIPIDANSGPGELTNFRGERLLSFTLEAETRVTEPPDYTVPLHVEFPGVGALIGYKVSAPPYTRDTPPQVTLIWQAGADEISTDYTVFAQLISAEGMVIAQSDHYPGERPTSGWVAGEFVIDVHTLTYNVEPQPGTLYVGLYDASTNTRVRLADGSDAVRLGE
ncbi:MAG: glycosyltransferase family 39 protein [Chloroflexi bacterium]|uniref:glycosyltransferase family 39 protein n=1 Tax=Candidatus Flexifilum breve TaxID=3140694 RepID=UPI0031347D09|nr:glycosyltransferase family 39 protein [Chloroflexota bacterium]